MRSTLVRIVFIVAVLASGSTATAQVIWEPPEWIGDEEQGGTRLAFPPISALRVGAITVLLEETRLTDLQSRLGGIIGHRGDAGDSLSWLCIHGADITGGWVLWLESGEIDGGMVGLFQLRRVDTTETIDSRCQVLASPASLRLPTGIHLGDSRGEVRRRLNWASQPTGDTWVYEHESQRRIRRRPYTLWNGLSLRFRDGVLHAIDVHQSTTD